MAWARMCGSAEKESLGFDVLKTNTADWVSLGAVTPTINVTPNVSMEVKSPRDGGITINCNKRFKVTSGMKCYWNTGADTPAGGWGNVSIQISNDNAISWQEVGAINSLNTPSGNRNVPITGDNCLLRLTGYAGQSRIVIAGLTIR